MTTDAKHVPPALSAEEWDDLTSALNEGNTGQGALGYYAGRYEWQQAMAVANASLPADSPYKITRADVAAALVGAESTRRRMHAEGRDFADAARHVDALRTIAAKLEALLPPDDA